MKTIETTTKDLEYYINLVDKVGVGCARTESNFERYSVGKILSNSLACYASSCHAKSLQSCLTLILWTVACQAPLSMGFSRQKYRRGLPSPSPGDLSDPGIEPMFSALASGFFTTSTTIEKSKRRIYLKEESIHAASFIIVLF